MALSRVVSEIFNVEKRRDLEIGVRGHSRSLKVVPFGRPCRRLPFGRRVFFTLLVRLPLTRLRQRLGGPRRSMELHEPFSFSHGYTTAESSLNHSGQYSLLNAMNVSLSG